MFIKNENKKNSHNDQNGQNNTTFWREEPEFDKSVSDTEAYVLKRVARAMLASLFPSTLNWAVVYHSRYYLIGCDVPKDVKVTNEHFQKTIQVYPKRIPRVWVQWHKGGLKMICKLWKVHPAEEQEEQEEQETERSDTLVSSSSSSSSRKRPRLDN